MAVDVTLSGSLNGLSAVGGQLGPAQFSYALNDEAQAQTKEIVIGPSDTGISVSLPSVGTQKLFYLKTTADVTVTINAEPAKDLKAGGVIVVCGGPNVTALSFDGNGTTSATVWVAMVGS